MIHEDRGALICDLAETYGIYDIKGLPVSVLATLSAGLGANSRIKKRLAGVSASQTDMLLATIADRLGIIAWFLSEDGKKGRNRPESILAAIMGGNQSESNVEAFDTADDFRAAWDSIKGAEHG